MELREDILWLTEIYHTSYSWNEHSHLLVSLPLIYREGITPLAQRGAEQSEQLEFLVLLK